MKKLTLAFLLCGTILFSFGCFLDNQQSVTRVTQPVKAIPTAPAIAPVTTTEAENTFTGDGFTFSYPSKYIADEKGLWTEEGYNKHLYAKGGEGASQIPKITIKVSQTTQTLDQQIISDFTLPGKTLEDASKQLTETSYEKLKLGENEFIKINTTIIYEEKVIGYYTKPYDKIVSFQLYSNPVEKDDEELKNILSTLKFDKPITAPDESAKATATLISFFDYLSKNDFQSSVPLFSENGADWQFLYDFYPSIEATNKAKLMETYCANTGTCLEAKVLETKQIADYEYNLTVQFLNKDGTTYIFGPCCGASEEQMPSKDKFDFIVKKVGETFQVITPPLYRP